MVVFSSVHRQRSNWNNTGQHLYLAPRDSCIICDST